MGNKPYRGYSALVALCTALIPAAADAQGVPADRIEAIERQIRNLQTELQQLKNELGDTKQQLRESRGEAQRAKEEVRQAQQAAEQARQNAARAATSIGRRDDGLLSLTHVPECFTHEETFFWRKDAR